MWEGVGYRTELQHIDPHSYGHNRVSFPFSWAAQPGGMGDQPLWDMFLNPASFLQLIWSPTAWFPSAQSGVPRPPSAGCCFLYSIIFQNRGSPGPLLPGAVFSTASFLRLFWSPIRLIPQLIWSPTRLIPNSSDLQLPDFLSSPGLYNCFTSTQSFPINGQRNMQIPPSLEWHVWSSSSGNNNHAVHRSPSSGASICDCTVGF